MQFITLLFFIWFLIKSVSFSIYEIKANQNKSGGTVCLIISILSFIIALIGLIRLYGQSFFINSY